MQLIEDREGSYRMGVDGTLVVARWYGKVTPATAVFSREQIQLAAKRSGPVTLVSVHHASDPKPGPAAIKALMREGGSVAAVTRRRIIVVAGRGFGASVIHSILGRVVLVSRSAPSQTFRTIEEAANLLEAQTGRNAYELLSTLEELKLTPVPELVSRAAY